VEARQDVLVYTSVEIRQPTEVTGDVMAELFISTTTEDALVMVKLVDVGPDGAAIGLCEGAMRLAFRDGFAAIKPATSDAVYRCSVRVGPISNLFNKGHRIRVEVSSSNFPRFEHPLSAGIIGTAVVTLHHDSAYPSRLDLPIATLPTT
jgi:putative CocE/NonD family hydrolase